MRGSGERAFIACTVDLLEAGVDIERLNAVVFFRYLQSPIKFYQMLGRGTRIHEETEKYKFWLYDYTGVTDLFGAEFISNTPRPGDRGGSGEGGDDNDGGDDGDNDGPAVGLLTGQDVEIIGLGRYFTVNRDGRDILITADEYRQEVVSRVLSEAHSLDEFRTLWIETKRRKQLITHLLRDNFIPEVIRDSDRMNDFDLYDFFGHHSYFARALTRAERGINYMDANAAWFAGMDDKPAIVLRGLGTQFAKGGTEALEIPTLWDVPEIARAGGVDALRLLGKPADVMQEAKARLFGV